MSQFTQKRLTTKEMEKAIKASIKKEIVARGINATTRQGNKELKFLISKLASQSFDNLEQTKVAGEKMGQHLSELLQQKNKQNLDAGLIRQVTFQKDFWSLAGLSVPKPSPTKLASPEESEPDVILPNRGGKIFLYKDQSLIYEVSYTSDQVSQQGWTTVF